MVNRSKARRMFVDERRELHQFLAGLGEAEWDSPSLCRDWTVAEVAGHLASIVGLTRLGLMKRNVQYGPGGEKGNNRAAAAWVERGPEAITSSLADPKKLGLGFFYPRWALAETLVHQQDMRGPLQQPRTIPDDHLRVALGVFLRLALVTRADRRRTKVSLRATDIDWSHGNGPEVQGPAESILLALARRDVAAAELSAELSGDGCDIFLERVMA